MIKKKKRGKNERNREKGKRKREKKGEKKRKKMSRVNYYLELLFQKYLSTADLNYYQSVFNSQKEKLNILAEMLKISKS